MSIYYNPPCDDLKLTESRQSKKPRHAKSYIHCDQFECDKIKIELTYVLSINMT